MASWLATEESDDTAVPTALTLPRHSASDSSTHSTMMVPLLHQGMLLVGVPFTESALSETRSGGTPYGPSHWSGSESHSVLAVEEKRIGRALGRRLADIARRLKSP